MGYDVTPAGGVLRAGQPRPVPLQPVLWDYARYVLNLVHWLGACCWRADKAGLVHLKWEYLTEFVPRSVWPELRDWLTDAARPGGLVLLCDRRSIPGDKSYGYALAEPYRRVRRVVCRDERLNGKIRANQAKEDKTLLPVHHWLRGNLDLLRFDMDRARAPATAAPGSGSERAPTPP